MGSTVGIFETYDPVEYKYLIIVPVSWVDAIYPLAEWKTIKGIPAYIATVEYIDTYYGGGDLAWKIREFIRYAYSRWRVQYVLLAGDVGYIPTRYIYNPDTDEGGFFEGTYKPTDWYFAGLDGTWDDDGDGIYGESSRHSIRDEMDWDPEVAVGRLPANSFSELQTMVNKILNYERNPSLEDQEWLRTTILCGGPIKLDGGYWQDFGVAVKENMRKSLPLQTRTIKFYHDTNVNNISKVNLIEALNKGSFIVNIDAHGTPRGFYDVEWWSWILPDSFLGASDVPNLRNFGKLPLVFAFSCLTASFDIETKGAWWYRMLWKTSIAEEFVKNPNGGAIAYVGWARVTWTVEQAEELFWGSFFDSKTGNFRPGLALLFAKREFGKIFYSKEDEILRKVYSSWHLLGDPEIPIWTDSPKRLGFSYTSNVWIGHEVSIRTVPEATVCVFDKKGYYKVLQADSEGSLSFVAQEYETSLSMVVTAHNFLPVVLSDALVVENYVIIDKAFISDVRCDVGSTQTVALHAKWALDSSDVESGNIHVNGSRYVTNGTGWVSFYATYDKVGKLAWTVTGVSCQGRTGFEKLIDDPYIIWDSVRITLRATDERIDVGSTAYYIFYATYEYDESDASLYTSILLNDTLTKTKVGRYAFETSKIVESKYDLTKFTTNTFSVIWDRVKIRLNVSDDRIDVGSTGTYTWSSIYEYDGAAFTGTLMLNDTLTKTMVGKYGYTVSTIEDSNYDLEAFTSNAFHIIFDKVSIAITISDNRVGVGALAPLSWTGVYRYDSSLFTGSVTYNDTLTKTTVGKYGYKVASVSDPLHGIAAFDTNEVYCIFDRVVTEVQTELTMPGNVLVKIALAFECDGRPVEGSSVIVNNIRAVEVSEGLYQASIPTWNPSLELNVRVETKGFETVEMKAFAYALGNIVFETLIPLLATVLVLLIRWKHTKMRK